MMTQASQAEGPESSETPQPAEPGGGAGIQRPQQERAATCFNVFEAMLRYFVCMLM